jgi:transcriptional regulator with XRE-family HTH domain
MEQHETLGAFLRRKREQRGPAWSQTYLAKRANVSHSTISRLESGKTKLPPMELLAKLAPWYRVGVLELWRRAGHLSGGDAEAITAFVAQTDPVELVRIGLERGPWPLDIQRIVWATLEARMGDGAE